MTGFRNPILPGFNPDPTIVCCGDRYFLATSTFEYFPGVPIYTSTDLVDWQLIGHALNRRSQLDMRTAEAAAGIYAPTLRYNEKRKRWYMTTACVFKNAKKAEHDSPPPARGFYVWTSDIWDESKWSDPVYYDVAGIDQDLFFDDDGKVWLSWATTIPDYIDRPGHFSLTVWTVQIDLDTGDSIGLPKLIRRNTTIGNRVAEGPHIFKKEGMYYLITAEGGTEIEHSEWISRSIDGPRGPWEVGPESTVNPLVYNGQDSNVMQTGHMDVVEGRDGQWWAVCLAVRPQRGTNSHLGRETFLAPVEWQDGWPVVNAGRKIALTGPEDSGLRRIGNEQRWKINFRTDLDLYKSGWYHCRTPIKPYHELSSMGLVLKCGQYTLQHDEAVSMLLKKQTAFVGTWRIEFEFEPTLPGEEAGVAVWWSKWAHCSVSIRGKRGTARWPEGQYGAELVFRKPKDEGNDFEEWLFEAPALGRVALEIRADPQAYTFFLGDQRLELGRMSAHLLVRTRPWDSIFTGTFLGLFAQGYGGFGGVSSATFRSVEWDGVLGGDHENMDMIFCHAINQEDQSNSQRPKIPDIIVKLVRKARNTTL